MRAFNLQLLVKNVRDTLYRAREPILKIIILEIIILFISFYSFIILNENQLLYVSSTLSQVLATLFGLSVTGYIFLDQKLENDVEADQTLIDIIGELKSKYKSKITFAGILTFLGITLCILNISLGTNNMPTGFFGNVIINSSISLSLLSIFKIIMFTIEIIDPEKIQKESRIGEQRLVEDIEANSESNSNREYEENISLENFLTKFNQIEAKLASIVESKDIVEAKDMPRGIYQSLHLLYSAEGIEKELLKRIHSLRKYRNYLVHGQDMTVNSDFYQLAEDVLKQLNDSDKR